MKAKKVLSLVLAVAMIIGTMSFSVLAEESANAAEVSVWDGSTSDAWLADGDPQGTSGDVFYIESAAELAGFAKYVN